MPNHDDDTHPRNNTNINTISTSNNDIGYAIDMSSDDDINSILTPKDEEYIIPAYATVTPSPLKRPQLIPNGRMAILWYLLSLIIVGLDQWTKWLAETLLKLHEPISVIEPVLNWTLAYNEGAAWSMLADQGGWQKWFFAAISITMSVLLIVYLMRSPRQAKWLNLGLALVLAGAIGNLIDRLRLGKVVDFIHVHYADVWHYPIFNIADIAICIGIAIILIDILFLEGKRNQKYRR